MKARILAAVAMAICLAFAATAQADLSSEYQATYEKVDKANAGPYAGGVAGRNLADDGVLTKQGTRPATDAQLSAAISRMQTMLAPAPTPTASTAYSTPTTSATGGYSSIPGVPASFAACVAERESSNGAASSNVYGILADPRGSGSLADQQAAFADLYAQYGTAPWAPYDGC